jgi:hypothetical protein
MVKPGYRTSEFWFTVVSFVFSGLYLVGLLDSNSQKDDLIQETSRGLEATILIIGQLTVLFKYVKGRTDLKNTWWNTATPEERKAFAEAVPLTPNAYREANQGELNEMRAAAGIAHRAVHEPGADVRSLQSMAGIR